MSVLDIEKVDGIATSDDGSQLAMLITDHLDWADEYNHLIQLQNKINAYISFIESKQYEEIYPEMNLLSFLIEIHFQYTPVQNCLKFIDTVNKQLQENNILIDYIVG